MLNGINLYLYGVVLKERNKKEEAKQAFMQALNKQPLLWSAWLELGGLVSFSESKGLFESLNSHWMVNFYMSNFKLDNQYDNECLSFNTQLLRQFPNSVFLLNQIAHIAYNS